MDQYELVSVYRFYCEYGREMDRWIDAAVRDAGKGSGGGPSADVERLPEVKTLWASFQRDYARRLRFKSPANPLNYRAEDLFACFFVFRRAFYHIFFNIIGTSRPIAELRSRVWESIVTHDLIGWMQGLHERMKDIPTLITGPSGTGKERVAEAIARSQYIPFDSQKKAFAIDFLGAFNPVNLSALSSLLIESELFGHVKGAFSGAVRDRVGRLQECPAQGAVFLDEIGELTGEIQVKLLRLLQTRRFEPVGSSEKKAFDGKVITATNRDLADEVRAGRFREDFYYRLCADQITTPSLREQLRDCPQDLDVIVDFVCRRVVGEERAAGFAREVAAWIKKHLGDHAWPGNFRELEQCVRSYTLRKEYHPLGLSRPTADEPPGRPRGDPVAEACETLSAAVLEGKIRYEEIKRRLFTLVRRGTPTAREAARRLGLRDYRTIQAWVETTDGRPADA
jgi:transcriptional regulator with GAF, ATPase, and Fis domain